MDTLQRAINSVIASIDAVSALDTEWSKTNTQLNRLFAVKSELVSEQARRETLAYSPKARKKTEKAFSDEGESQ